MQRIATAGALSRFVTLLYWRRIVAAAVLYVREFYRGRPGTFEGCLRRYAARTADELLAESRWLFGYDTELLPFFLLSKHAFALFRALVEHSAGGRDLSFEDRNLLSKAAESIQQEILSRSPPRVRDDVARFLREMRKAVLENIREAQKQRGQRRVIHPGSTTVQ